MESIRVSRQCKIAVLIKIKESQGKLFGPISGFSNKQERAKVWQNIHEFSKKIGAVNNSRHWVYTRDVFWPNMKRGTLKKLQNRKEGKKINLNEVDELVLQILTKKNCHVPVDLPTKLDILENDSLLISDSPLSEPEQPETSENVPETITKKLQNRKEGKKTKLNEVDELVLQILSKKNVDLPTSKSELEILDNDCVVMADSPLSEPEQPEASENVSETIIEEDEVISDINVAKRIENVERKRFSALKYEELELKVELLRKENYLKQLEIFKMERELGVMHEQEI